MKFKYFIVALAGFSAIALVGCNKANQNIVDKAASMDLAFKVGKDALIKETERNELLGDKSERLLLSTKQTVKFKENLYL